MEIFLNILIIFSLFLFVYFLFKPKKQPNSKEQKQEELYLSYKERIMSELSTIEDFDERQKKKIALLKVFATELKYNLFFDEEEVKTLIQNLANY